MNSRCDMDLPSKVWWAAEIRIWTFAAAAVLAVISFAITWAQTRWQTELSVQRDAEAQDRERQSNERIASAQADAARANERTAELSRETEILRQENAKLTERLAPRTLNSSQQQAQNTQPTSNTMLVITLGEMEAANFGEEIIIALTAAGVNVLRITIGSISPPVYGVIYFEDNWSLDTAAMLQRINIRAIKSSVPLPIPGIIRSRYVGIPAILVGLKPPP